MIAAPPLAIRITAASMEDPQVRALIVLHLAGMRDNAPPEN